LHKLALYQKASIVDLSSSAIHTIQLPPVLEAMGEFYSVRVTSVGTGGVLTVVAPDAAGWTDAVLDAAGDHAMFYSDGEKWFTLELGITP
jgi:hypothetical protein